jgi:hypothetical protein
MLLCVIGYTIRPAEGIAQQEKPATETSVRMFLQDYLGAAGSQDKSTRYVAAFAALSDSSKQNVIVYVTGASWCGSGGGTTLILAPDSSSYRVVAKITVSRPPIRALISKSKGWHDIAVHIQGGGIQPGYEAQLLFDGNTYPSNPPLPRLGD